MSSLRFSGFEFEPHLRRVTYAGAPIELPTKAFDVLSFMAANPGRLLTKTELLEAVWPDAFVEEANLTHNIFLLRRALGEPGAALIRTVPGRGYQFTAMVTAVAPAVEPASGAGPPAVQAVHHQVVYEEEVWDSASLRRSPLVWAVATALLLVVAAISWLVWEHWQDRTGGAPVQVVLADPEGTTGDPALDRTLNNVMRLELAQSPFVTVLPAAVAQQKLAEMLHKPSETLTVPLARELCERTGSQAVLDTSLARAGAAYLFTEQATNCVDGAMVASVSEKVSAAEDLPTAVNRAASSLRRQLGESRRTIARFDAPLLPAMTGSLDALKDFTEATQLGNHGHYAEAMQLLKQAVTLDPKFAGAYINLSIYSSATLANADALTYVQKAYDLREFATEPARLYIVARYETLVTQDLYAALRNYTVWTETYPRSPQAWSGLQNLDLELGRWNDSLIAARRLVQLVPDNPVAIQQLADSQMRVGDFHGAQTTCELALSRGFDTEGIRFHLLRLAHLQQDSGLLAAQEQWLAAHPNSPTMLANEAELALQEGRLHDAQDYLDRMRQAFVAQGQASAIVPLLQEFAYVYSGLGDVAKAHELLYSAPLTPELQNLFTLVALGEPVQAETLRKHALEAHPQSTILTKFDGPILSAEVALAAGKPDDAVAALEPARDLDALATEIPFLRGQAYRRGRRLPEAEAEFRKLLAHPGIDPLSWQLPMARLELAGTLADEGRKDDALREYVALLAFWDRADRSLPAVQRAQQELAALQGGLPSRH